MREEERSATKEVKTKRIVPQDRVKVRVRVVVGAKPKLVQTVILKPI